MKSISNRDMEILLAKLPILLKAVSACHDTGQAEAKRQLQLLYNKLIKQHKNDKR